MRRWLGFALKAGVSIALLAFAVRGINLAAVGERLRSLKIEWMIGALALCFVQCTLLSIRWREIARTCEAPLTFRNSLRMTFIAAFFNQVLPSTVGGDAMRIWMFGRSGASWSKAAYSVLLDRFVGVLALAILVVACLPWTFTLVQNPLGRSALLLIGLGSIGAALAFLALGSLRWNWPQRWAPVRHLTQMARTARAVLFSTRTGTAVMALSLVIQSLTAGMAWCGAHAVDAPLGFFPALALIPPVMLIATVPISVAGWGVREKSLVLAFAYAGLAPGDGFLVSVLLGATMFAMGIVGGFVWLVSGRKTEMDEEPSPAPPIVDNDAITSATSDERQTGI